MHIQRTVKRGALFKTSRHQPASDTTKCSLERQKIFSYKLVLSDINKFAKCKAERAGCR